jgi:pyridoxal phosphate enzyme (YggS family)
MSYIPHNIQRIKNDIKTLSRINNITVVAVTKTVSSYDILQSFAYGITNIGESKIQEAIPKFIQIGEHFKGIIKHFIGHIQSNKAKKIVEHFDLIQSVDSITIATLIDKYAKQYNKLQHCLIEVKMHNIESRAGISINYVRHLYQYCLLKLPNILIRGLMVIAPCNAINSDLRKCFRQVYIEYDKIKKFFLHSEFNILSMGMSSDYKIAIEEGATMLRLGSAIFGNNNKK